MMFRILLIFAALVLCTSAVPRQIRQAEPEDDQIHLAEPEDDQVHLAEPEDDQIHLAEPEDDPCLLPKDVGPCRGAKPMYYFDSSAGLCVQFAFGGCDGNGNRFKTREECTETCKGHITPLDEVPSTEENLQRMESEIAQKQQQEDTEQTTEAAEDDVCSQPPLLSEVKRCRALLPRYHFNSSSGQCEFYIYNGCGGSKNLFSSQNECKKVCAPEDEEETRQAEDQTSNDPCSLPREVGRCFAAIPRYAFDKESGKCVRFIYGGCGGNENNFQTMEDCEQKCGEVLPVTTEASESSCDRSQCNSVYAGHYLELNCTPIYTDDSCCPTSYDCNHVTNRDASKCYLRGKAYEEGEEIPREASTAINPCSIHCRCQEDYTGEIGITCISIECPELFSGPLRNGCKRLYTAEKCCSVDTYCPPGVELPSQEGQQQEGDEQREEKPIECTYNGEEMVAGEKFYPEEEPCKTCICQTGFNGSFTEPWCQNVDCGIELHYSTDIREGCAPVYFQDKCCPISWRCPSESDKIVHESSVDIPEQEMTTQVSQTVKQEMADQASPDVTICAQPKVVGPCKANKPRFYFDTQLGKCVKFSYGGCRGNDNNFKTIKECVEICSNYDVQKGKKYGAISTEELDELTPQTSDPENPCTLKPYVGPCQAKTPRFYFDADTGACNRFYYGGCKSNGNNFKTEEECRTICMKKLLQTSEENKDSTSGSSEEKQEETTTQRVTSTSPLTKLQDNPCKLKPEKGPCRARKPRYYFDVDTKTCNSFFYGGCKGNSNNFKTAEECRTACKKTSILTSEESDSSSSSEEKQRMTKEQVTSTSESMNLQATNSCQMAADVGPCSGNYIHFYYNTTNRMCEPFYYGGCGGNKNNFAQLSKCRLTCEVSAYEKQLQHLSENEEEVEEQAPVTEIDITVIENVIDLGYGDVVIVEDDSEDTFKENDGTVCNSTNTGDGPVDLIEVPLLHIDCLQPTVVGPCEAIMQHYFFNASSGQCQMFIYGGCGGNANNFLTLEECSTHCHFIQDTTTKPTPVPEVQKAHSMEHCKFGNLTMDIGDMLDKTEPCVDCKCSLPPLPTCIHMRCPTPPADETCTRVYDRSQCCPKYECSDSPNTDPCAVVRCADGKTCSINDAGKAQCIE